MEVEYRGEQSLLNGKDCGRFASYYAAQIAQSGSLQGASREGAEAFLLPILVKVIDRDVAATGQSSRMDWQEGAVLIRALRHHR